MGKAIIIEQVEIWKEISGYEGYYKVSNLGRILSIRSNKIMSPEVTRKGYLRVTFSCNGKFQARLNIGKDTLYLGVFDTPQLASNAYKKALESL